MMIPEDYPFLGSSPSWFTPRQVDVTAYAYSSLGTLQTPHALSTDAGPARRPCRDRTSLMAKSTSHPR